MNKNKPIEIFHDPYGEQHPYESMLWERVPRQPSSEDAVALGVRIGRSPVVDEVWCDWNVGNDIHHHRADAVKRDSDETFDYWQICLPPFKESCSIQYRFFARCYEQLVNTEDFCFDVFTWEQVRSPISVEVKENTIQVVMETTRNDLNTCLSIGFNATNQIVLQVEKSEKKTSQGIQEKSKFPVAMELNGLQIEFKDDPFGFRIQTDDKNLDLKCEKMKVLVGKDGKIERVNFAFDSPENEAFYGFGERFNAFDQRGNCLINRVFAKYTRQGMRSYIPVPFFLSSLGYGFWLKTDRWVEFDLAASDKNKWILLGEPSEVDGKLEMIVFQGGRPYDLVRDFTDITGKPILPPSWAFGLWMSSNDWNSQKEINRQLSLSQKYNIPATVMVIEAWSDEINYYIWNDATYDFESPESPVHLDDFSFPKESHWEDPKALVDAIHEAGMRLVLWQIPVIKKAYPEEHLDETWKNKDQEFALEHGFLVMRPDGTPHEIEVNIQWFPKSKVIDFTNPEAEKFWFQKRAYLLNELDIDGFKTDGGEHIWDLEAKFSNGTTGRSGINLFPLQYERAYQLFLDSNNRCAEKNINDRLLFSRAGYTGSQQYSCHWAGDEESTWDAYRATIRAMFNIGLCGVSFIGWDIAGFAGPLPDSELYLRATAFSTFCPIMQFHSDFNARRIPSRDRTPWNVAEQTKDERVIPVFRAFTNLRMNLLPYILSQAWQSNQSGLPLMRAVFLEYFHDEKCKDFPYEYMFGDTLLVAPVVEEGINTLDVYLPSGEWADIWSGKIYSGPGKISISVPIDKIPVFQRKGSILPLNLDAEGKLGSHVGNGTDHFDHLVIRVFPGEDCKLPLNSGKDGSVSWISCEKSGKGTITLKMPAMQVNYEIVIMDLIAKEVYLDQDSLKQVDKNSDLNTWNVQEDDKSTKVRLASNSSPSRLEIKAE